MKSSNLSHIFLLFTLNFCITFGKSLIQITDDNWNAVLEGEWMVEFMAPWCPACRQFTETWNKFADWGRDLDIKVGVVDVTENPELSGRFLVSALPSIYHIKDGEFRQYKASRKEEDLISFVDDKKWNEIIPVAWYLSPGSLQMGAVGFFFKLAMNMRALYTTMTDQYGIPEWGCYVICAIGTIIAGLTLGLLIVFLCDLFTPSSRPIQPSPVKNTPPKDGQDSNQGDKDEDIIDDTEEPSQNTNPQPSETTDKDVTKKPKSEETKPQTRKRNVRKEN